MVICSPFRYAYFHFNTKFQQQKGKYAMIEQNAMACNRFLVLVRDFCVRVKPWHTAIRYHTKPDEVRDLTKVSQRVYGRREEVLAIMAAAGLSTMDQPLAEQLLILPTESQLQSLKQRAGFENNHSKRQFRGG